MWLENNVLMHKGQSCKTKRGEKGGRGFGEAHQKLRVCVEYREMADKSLGKDSVSAALIHTAYTLTPAWDSGLSRAGNIWMAPFITRLKYTLSLMIVVQIGERSDEVAW